MCLCVAYIIRGNSVFDVLRELTLERFVVLILQGLHVVGNVLGEDVLPVDIGVEGLRLVVVAGEPLGADNVTRTKNKRV